MKHLKTIITLFALCLLFGAGKANAQWTVIDPSNIAQSIVNSSKSIVQESKTATHMVKSFQETVKSLRTGKEILRCTPVGQQPCPRRPQGTADGTDAR